LLHIAWIPGIVKTLSGLAYADMLIAECTNRSRAADPNWPHFNPEDAAWLAKEAGAKKPALVHFDASRYTAIESREEAVKHVRKVFTKTFAVVGGRKVSF
jgi:ribonuclease BN (tRNA processing enzyme)